MYCRIKYPTGILLSCPWLHALIKEELRKLHGSSPHVGSPVGVIVSSRAECTLASVTPEAAGQLLPHAAALQASLDAAHLSALEHGLIHMEIKPSNIVVTKGSLQLIDWGNAKSNVCFSKLPEAPNKGAILRCILLMTEGIVQNALSKKLQKEEQRPTSGLWQRLLSY
jgi:serine/threonine protein kinase